ncbi:hypothetical protein ABW18_00805 [Gordonia jacobaea]|uniref:Uncharacterized protein n=1 Tax=Gordonia jacobaea TaxID=122202 RepID=A0ABR5IH25_9ACTN|nr:hypothetical protein ABW18_00805 [Gordonia jacobaea]
MYPSQPQPPSAQPPGPSYQPPYPMYPPRRRARTPLGDRGPWWAQALVSAAIGGFFFVVSCALQIALSEFGLHDWWRFSVWTLAALLYVGVLAVWARSTPQRILGPGAALVLLGLQRVLDALWAISGPRLYSGWTYAEFEWWYSANNGLVILGVVAGWSLARRKTAFALIGIIPALALSAAGGWIEQAIHYPKSYITASLLDGVVFIGFCVLGILSVWACDGIGLAIRRGRTQSRPVPAYPHPGY